MTKELSAKRKVDECCDTHPREKGMENVRPIAGLVGGGFMAIGLPGVVPAPGSGLALIELGLSFDSEWGERTDLCVETTPSPNYASVTREC